MQEEIKTIEEIEREYPNEFISIYVTEFDWSIHEPLKGRVIAHGKDKKAVRKAESEFTRKHPGEITFFDITLPMPESVLL